MFKLIERRSAGEQGFAVPIGDCLTIGRSPDNLLHLEDRSVSSVHAEVRMEDGKPVILDRGSTNGVWVNGERVQSRPLQSGDLVKIGIYEMLVVEEHPEVVAEKTVMMESPPSAAGGLPVPSGSPPGEGEGEKTFPGESTAPEIPRPPAGDATVFAGQGSLPPPVARLVCLKGPEAGREYALTETVTGLGRAEDSTIHVNDDSISRHHAEIVRAEEGGYTLRDKGSRNGTLIGETRVDSVLLEGGEEIVLGNVRFRFVAPGEIFSRAQPGAKEKPAGSPVGPAPAGKPPKPPAPGGRKRLVLIGGIGGGVLLLLALLLLLMPGTPPPKPKAEPSPPSGAAPEDQKQKVREIYQQGVSAARGRNWDEAIKAFDQVLAADPAFALAKDAKADAERERQVQAKMNEVSQLLGQGKLEEAATLAQALPASAVYDKEIVLLRKRVKDEMLKSALAKAEGYLKEKKLADARAALDSAESLDPGNETAKRLRSDIATAEAEQKRAAVKAKKEARESAGAAPGGRWMDAYLKGFLSEAVEHLRRAGDEKTAAKVERVRVSYEKGLTLYQEGKLAQAYGEWDRTLQEDREISRGKRSFVAREIGRIMAKEYVSRGASAFEQKDYEAASKNWRKAVAIDPGNAEAEAGLARLTGIARKLYEEGYVLESVNLPAAQAKWRQVIAIVPPSDPYHRKAAEKLKKYEGNS